MCLAVPGRILELREERGVPMATVGFDRIHKDVCLAYLPEAAVGDYVLVHVGFAISIVDEASAVETLATFAELGMLDEELAVESGESGGDGGDGGP